MGAGARVLRVLGGAGAVPAASGCTRPGRPPVPVPHGGTLGWDGSTRGVLGARGSGWPAGSGGQQEAGSGGRQQGWGQVD
jgi:hypothetical protein